MFDAKRAVPIAPLYRDVFEHDNCGIGACVDIKGKKSHGTVENALKIVETWSIGQARMQRGKPAMGWVS